MIDISQWVEPITVSIASSTPNEYGEYTFTSSTINGRLVLREKEIVSPKGEVMTSVAKLYTISSININSQIGVYKIISKKACKDKHNIIAFYTYELN